MSILFQIKQERPKLQKKKCPQGSPDSCLSEGSKLRKCIDRVEHILVQRFIESNGAYPSSLALLQDDFDMDGFSSSHFWFRSVSILQKLQQILSSSTTALMVHRDLLKQLMFHMDRDLLFLLIHFAQTDMNHLFWEKSKQAGELWINQYGTPEEKTRVLVEFIEEHIGKWIDFHDIPRVAVGQEEKEQEDSEFFYQMLLQDYEALFETKKKEYTTQWKQEMDAWKQSKNSQLQEELEQLKSKHARELNEFHKAGSLAIAKEYAERVANKNKKRKSEE